MRIAFFSTKSYDRQSFDEANRDYGHEIGYFEPHLDAVTASLAAGWPAVCAFVNDRLNAAALAVLAEGGTRLVAMRCAGFNNVDLAAAEKLGIAVVRVPAYSPEAVSEFTIGLMLALDRKIHRAWARVRENNFSLDGLLGLGLHGRVAGVVGTGRIGGLVARALRLGFGCEVLATDRVEDPALIAAGVRYVPVEQLMAEADIVTLHCPLTPGTHHLVNAASLATVRPGFQLINTSRGALVDADALIDALKSGRIGGVALDVYEQEGDLFFEDLSNEIIQDDVFQRLLTFPNVLVTGHQAFLTRPALQAIARTTLQSATDFAVGRPLPNRLGTSG
ncbi:2-hydroxyacid dehydrogenase [Pseudoroseomonas ludipueritiae]|uniref:2-hydroxyacid dehydrogenase n=1 Tax=Pseudoroseomonas ludipueritiae TaxID=198093 RepID=A0ABR7R3Y7_9PROT|nr:2-hydroxyacid dehydrogenase [Pseudoroseomonas ludipueritiae]MBC9176423.1 2-hydroxyacid dehydrogenase [Pseudoroseomonas ludipueritiae]